MSSSILDSVLAETSSAPRSNGKARIVSEQHDSSKIDIRTDTAGIARRGNRPNGGRSWDESEYGISEAAAQVMLQTEEGRRQLAQMAVRRANLYSRNGKIAMFAAGQAPWHGLGVLVDQAASSAEALKFASLDNWNLTKVQQQIDWGGKLIPVDGQYAVVRGDTGKILGSVGERYTVFSNEDAFQFLDDVIGQSRARYETAGAIGDGSVVWVLAKFKDVVEVAHNDTLTQYLLCGTSHDGSSAIWVVPTNERVVCANTYRVAMSDKSKAFSFRHTKNVAQRSKEVAAMLGIVHERQEQFAEKAQLLAKTPLVGADVNEYFEGCIDDICDITIAGQQLTKATEGEVLATILRMSDIDAKHKAERAYERAIERRKEVLEDILMRHESERCNGIPAIAGTAWSATNAVTEHVDHSPLVRYKGSDLDRAESRFSSTLQGNGAELKELAVERALAYASN